MTIKNNLLSYEQQFGEVDFKQGEHARSVYSPAAYLADLLQLLDDYFGNPDLGDRRPEIKNIDLDAKHTFNLIPYLDIVNELLENKINNTPAKVYEKLRTSVYPFNQPFNLYDEKIKLFFQTFDMDREGLYKLFHTETDSDDISRYSLQIARSYLGLSDELTSLITNDRRPNNKSLKAFYNLGTDQQINHLSDLSLFQNTTGLTGPQCRELIVQNLVEDEQDLAGLFFINHGLKGYVKFDSSETRLDWHQFDGAMILEEDDSAVVKIPDEWFARVNRLIRLSSQCDISISDLDLILRSCCDYALNQTTLPYIAVIKKISESQDLAIDKVCCFFAEINHIGFGQEHTPADLFNRIFNGQFAELEQRYFKVSASVPPQYKSLKEDGLLLKGDLFSQANTNIRNRLRKSLHLSEKDLLLLHETFEEKGLIPEDLLKKLSLFYRISQLAKTLDLSLSDLFILLDLLHQDSTIRKVSNLDTLIHFNIKALDCYRILTQNRVDESMWLVQILFALSSWMNKAQLSANDLKTIQTGEYLDKEEQANAEQKIVSGLNNLYQQIKPLLLSADFFVSEQVDVRKSRVIVETITGNDSAIISGKDNRLLQAAKDEIDPLLHQALNQLQIIQQTDLAGLGLQQKVQQKIYSQLLLNGYINTDGMLIDEVFPQSASDFQFSHEFDSQSVLDLIQQVQQSFIENNSEDIAEDFSLYISDFAELGLTDTQVQELYSNLIFNDYINENGELQAANLYLANENTVLFNANSGLENSKQKIYDLIVKRTALFDTLKISVSEDLFDGLPLKEIEITDLIENLRFNDYIDNNNQVINNTRLLNLKIDRFDLALMYYPYRHQILARIQKHLKTFKSVYYQLSEEDFNNIADQIIADSVYAFLENNHLQEKRFGPESLDFFLDDDNANALKLDRFFSENDAVIVFKKIQTLIKNDQQYRVTAENFTELGLSESDVRALLKLMEAKQYIHLDGSLSHQQTAYFLNVNNALDIKLESFEDYAKDIFFIVHARAKVIENTVHTLSANILALTQAQKETVLSALQELLEIPVDSVEVICRHVFNTQENLVEHIMVPVLALVDANGQIKASPDNYLFNSTFSRIQQFARLAVKLDLNAVESDIVFRDQSLSQKFSENLTIPQQLDAFDFLIQIRIDPEQFDALESKTERDVIVLYSSAQSEPGFWLYSVDDYQPLTNEKNEVLTKLCPLLTESQINAAFNDHQGNVWFISGSDFFYQKKGQLEWVKKEKILGKIQSNFEALDKIDAAYVDAADRIYLFTGDQYIRCSKDLKDIDEGYPKKIEANWKQERGLQLPERFNESIDSAFFSPNQKLYLFKDDKFIHSDNAEQELTINEYWGKVKNNFTEINKIDAALALHEKFYFFAGDQCLSWSDCVESQHALADEGSIQSLSNLIPNLPDEFNNGIDAIFLGFDNKIHIFSNGKSIQSSDDFKVNQNSIAELNKTWGKITNKIASSGKISAAFSGLDGKAYLFSDNQYYRYSGSNYEYVDQGYPKIIAENWGGLTKVDAAFILDGKSYLMGKNQQNKIVYVRYSTNDYSIQDDNYPKPVKDNWWLEHFNLQDTAFSVPDTVFIGADGTTYLLKDDQYIAYDKLHRWWSESQAVSEKWSGVSFDKVDAAFTGKDGRTYLFSGTKFVRYADKHFNKLIDRELQISKKFWGRVKNNIAENNRIDAALVIDRIQTEAGEQQVEYTYLFSGDQYFRYSGKQYKVIDEGYPKTLADELKLEPRFTHVEDCGDQGVDAALADQRNVYLFKNNLCHVVSDTKYRLYQNPEQQRPNAVIQDQGKTYLQHEGIWQTLKNLEGKADITKSVAPVFITRLAESFTDFQSGQKIDTAFIGTDKTLYAFNEGLCYNDTLEKSYPINEEWGRVRNPVLINNHIDAAFVGVDGKIYIFSDNQFLSYTPADENESAFPGYVDDHPKAINEHWGGLDNVNLAYVKEGKTYLMETADEQGNFRYLCYSGDDYTQPDSEPQYADISWWKFPSIYLEQGFDRIDAVLVEDEHLYLFKEDQFIQFNNEENLWTYPRPVSLIWKNLTFSAGVETEIVTVLAGSDDQTYFFSQHEVVAYDNNELSVSDPEAINLNWGKQNNHLVEKNVIDAAVVINDQITYLFSGDQYVRYSSADYRYVDDNYPKQIIENLRQETHFKNLPESFDQHLKTFENGNSIFSGIVANERNMYLFEGKNCHVVSIDFNDEFEISRLGKIKNNLLTVNRVDAAFVNENNQTFLFSADQYIRYSDDDYQYVDEGYPKAITESFVFENPGVAIAEEISKLDAAVNMPSESGSNLVLFSGNSVYQSKPEIENNNQLADLLQLPENAFSSGVNAAIAAPNGKTYFFNNGQYICYSRLENDYVDEGYPKAIRDNWGNLPEPFEVSIDHAFVFEGKTYLVKGDEYVRYSTSSYQLIDAIYPQKFKYRWGSWSDYLLIDIKIISEFKQLLEYNLSKDYSLTDLLDFERGYKKQSYLVLSEIFGWDINQLKWLKRKNAFYKNELVEEVNFTIELILKIKAIFDFADKMSVSPSTLYESVAGIDLVEPAQAAQVAESLYHWLGLKYSDKDWQQLSTELHDKVNLIKQDALLPYVIAADDDQVDNARDLFAKLLIDVEMGSDARTSKIKNAISAVQLYIHRYFVNLESIELSSQSNRDQLKQWWKWMRNYRIWEANRKVFLYPENYIRPELRDTKSPAFKKLEQALLQGDVTQELVKTAFHDYLNDFAQVGNLRITGANVYDDPNDPDTKILVLFGHTRTEPGQYYYRTASFTKKENTDSNINDTVIWNNWSPIDITINSTRVFPIFAFGRILVMWTEIEAFEETKPLIVTDNSTSKVETEDTVLKHRANIKYSFYDFNQQWVNPQTLTKQGVELEYKVDAAYVDKANQSLVVFAGEFCLVSTRDNPQGDLKRIADAYKHLPKEFHSGIDAAVRIDTRTVYFKDKQCFIDEGAAAESEGKISAQLISEVFKPDPDDAYINAIFEELKWKPAAKQEGHKIRYQEGVSAAFLVNENQQNKKICLIDKIGLPVFFKADESGFIGDNLVDLADVIKHGFVSLIFEYIRILTRNLLRLDPVDAVFEDEKGTIYMLRRGQYECYKFNKDSFSGLEKLKGFPKPIKGNLSFNMDQFYNRLHLAESNQNGEDFISLTYTSPDSNSPLLTGKIKADFTFEEGDPWQDQNIYAAWELDQKVRIPPRLVSSSSIVDLNKLIDIDLWLDKTIQAEAVQVVLPEFNEALDIVKSIIEQQNKLVQQARLDVENNNDISFNPDKIDIQQSDIEAFSNLMSARDTGVIPRLHELNRESLILLTRANDFKRAFDRYTEISMEQNWLPVFEVLKNEFHRTNENIGQVQQAIFLDGLKEEFSKSTINKYDNQVQQFKNRHNFYYSRYIKYLNEIMGVTGINKEIVADSSTKLLSRETGTDNFNFFEAVTDFFDGVFETGSEPEIELDSDIIQPDLIKDIKKYKEAIAKLSNAKLLSSLDQIKKQSELDHAHENLNLIKKDQTGFDKKQKALQSLALSIEEQLAKLLSDIIKEANILKERYFGKNDVFPENFNIKNKTNFTFSEPDWHIFEEKMGTFLCRPLDITGSKYEIIRLTTTTIPELSKILFTGGVEQLFSIETQSIHEKPYFPPLDPKLFIEQDEEKRKQEKEKIDENTINYNAKIIIKVPTSKHLDYHGASENYYWEIFFHAPFLIAQTLNNAQKFEQAKTWYEYIFDPTALGTDAYWKFLPFKQAAEIQDNLKTELKQQLDRTLVVSDLATEIKVYQNDPFDPHAIARIRQIAYQKSIVMRYIDNLLDWGDMLFRQYSMESINEARMLYVLAYDLLGEKPESLGNKLLPETSNYSDLINPTKATDLLPQTDEQNKQLTELDLSKGTVHQSVTNSYFHIPENDLFLDYWNRVEDRLYKLRHSLNIEGQKQALPLFQPPIDPMSVVQSVAAGASLSQIVGGGNVVIPHYRFDFMIYKAKDLVQKLNQFGGELLATLEKRDSEQLSMMQHKQEAEILSMMTKVKEAQIEEAKQSIISLQASLEMVKASEAYNQSTVDKNFLIEEGVQIALMSTAAGFHVASAIFRAIASPAGATPDILLGPFITGTKAGGQQAHSSLNTWAEFLQTSAEGLSVGGEVLGIVAQHKRLMDDTQHQVDTAAFDKNQIEAQIEGAQQQLKIAEYELIIHHKEIEQHKSITNFMTGKFSNEQLYQWMSSQLSGLYYQTYKMTHDMAKAAEKAFQFERGLKQSEVSYINGLYWNSQRKGLLAGDSLALDLDRMEQAFIQTDKRRFEISKSISLLELDPMAFLVFKAKGSCEFEFSESLFDYDFQGHYCRQIKTIAISFDAAEGQTVNATLTQLNNKTVIDADPKAVKYLIDPKDTPPQSLRYDWRASQQIALSHLDEYDKGNGLFELRFDDDRYLPFEGTGAVSRWRLELNGKRGSVNMTELLDATITIKYTALQGGEAFADVVRGLLKPYDTVRFFDLNFDFHEEWLDFLENDDRSLTLQFTQQHFPNIASSRISGLFSKFEVVDDENVTMILNNDETLLLSNDQFLETPGLQVGNLGSSWTFTVQGNKAALKTLQMVVGYKARV